MQEEQEYPKYYMMEDKDMLSTIAIQANEIDEYGVQSIRIINESGASVVCTKKNKTLTKMYNTPEKYEGTYIIQGEPDDSYITLEYNPDFGSYYYEVVIQGEVVLGGWDAFVSFGMILSSEMQMNLNEYLDGTEDVISVFIPKYANMISVIPEQEIR